MSEGPSGGDVARFTLEPAPPFRLDLTAWALRRRPDNVVDRLDAGVYRRVIVADGTPVALAVRQVGGADEPVLAVEAAGPLPEAALADAARAALVRILGLAFDMSAFHEFAAADPYLGPLAARLRGIRPPRYPSAFEALVNAVACQQITL